MMAAKKGGLGRGLDSLIPAAQTTTEYLVKEGAAESVVALSKITPNPNQPRKVFDKQKLSELSASIKEHGVISPILVTKWKDGYRIVAGERRYRAAVMAGLLEVPVLIKDFTDKEILEVSLIENVQRENLSAIEEAAGYKVLCDEFSLTQDEVAARVGKSRVAVANAMRLLFLPEKVKALIDEGVLSPGQGRAVLMLEDDAKREEFGQYIAENSLSVRECERLSKTFGKNEEKKEKTPKAQNPDTKLIEEEISEKFGVKTAISGSGNGRGKLTFEYYSVEALNAILDKLGINKRGY